jgi:hypothetical protein
VLNDPQLQLRLTRDPSRVAEQFSVSGFQLVMPNYVARLVKGRDEVPAVPDSQAETNKPEYPRGTSLEQRVVSRFLHSLYRRLCSRQRLAIGKIPGLLSFYRKVARPLMLPRSKSLSPHRPGAGTS